MSEVSQIDIHSVHEHVQAGTARIVDIRDPMSFSMGHIPTAVHLSDGNVEEFINEQDKTQPLIVCCYHGISSQGVAAYLKQQGFQEVHSMIGGYEAWSQAYPSEK